ncbi:sensor histidine kinase [Radicibacter daui]|uniref:sensor histidine kinase n=1 Tax=Radicibacter daui TaxID=3064829 RepID=UPI004046A33C
MQSSNRVAEIFAGSFNRRLTSLRLRLLFMVAISLLPVLVLASFQAVHAYNVDQAETRASLRRSAAFVTQDQSDLFIKTQGLLTALAATGLAGVPDAALCQQQMQRLASQVPDYTNIGIVNAEGTMICASADVPSGMNFAGFAWFKAVRSSDGVVIGSFQLGVRTNRPIVVATAPILRDGKFYGAVLAAIKLEQLDRLATSGELPPEAVAQVVDAHGAILTAGAKVAEASRLPPSSVLRPRLNGTMSEFEAESIDKVSRVFVVTPLFNADIYAVFGMPTSTASGWARLNLASRIMVPLAMWFIALVAAWIFSERLVLRWIGRLRRAAHAYALGAYSIRPDMTGAPRELSELGRAFSSMAENIEQQTLQLRHSIEEKETLIKEIHHRVKNNLQTVVSLLNLQSRSLPDPQSRRVLLEAQTRINALALVHRGIYETADLASVELPSFTLTLCRQVAASFGWAAQNIDIKVDVPAEPVPQERVVPLALLITEALTNVFKHAFAPGQRGQAWVSVLHLGGRDGRLVIADNGKGSHWQEVVPTEGAQSPAAIGSGLGRSLMQSFARQLGGDCEVTARTGGGTQLSVDLIDFWYAPFGEASATGAEAAAARSNGALPSAGVADT